MAYEIPEFNQLATKVIDDDRRLAAIQVHDEMFLALRLAPHEVFGETVVITPEHLFSVIQLTAERR